MHVISVGQQQLLSVPTAIGCPDESSPGACGGGTSQSSAKGTTGVRAPTSGLHVEREGVGLTRRGSGGRGGSTFGFPVQ